MDTYEFSPGRVPLLVSMPHDGTRVPDSIAARMAEHALRLPDTDWNVSRLYAFARDLGAAIIRPRYSRYVVDLNRAPDNRALYPGASNTELCPLSCFDFEPIYRPGQAPDAGEIEERVATYWRPYHARLGEELEVLRDTHGIALLYDAHSIRSRVPRFFEGTLPDLNLGTADGASAASALETRLAAVAGASVEFATKVNGRFKGGYITRAYGRPGQGVHAVQLELSQRTYMDEAYPFTYHQQRAARVQPVLRALLEAMLDWGHGAALNDDD